MTEAVFFDDDGEMLDVDTRLTPAEGQAVSHNDVQYIVTDVEWGDKKVITLEEAEDTIFAMRRHERDDNVSLDFHLNVPKPPNRLLPSSVTVEEDDSVKNFELRLGLVSKEKYSADDLETLMMEILETFDLPPLHEDYVPPDGNRTAYDEINAKIGYDPHWGEVGYYQTHLECNTFFPVRMSEQEFIDFAREYTEQFIDAIEWDDE